MDYSEFPGLSPYYLEDSFILAIDETDKSLTFNLEVVLTERHPDYTQPKPDEQHCFAGGLLAFDDPLNVNWLSRNFRTNTDASGSEDLGNIDFFEREGNSWRLGGDWGEVLVTTDAAPVIMLRRWRRAIGEPKPDQDRDIESP